MTGAGDGVGVTGVGSGKLAGEVALLVAAEFSVPMLSGFVGVGELEKRLEEENNVEATGSDRSGRVLRSRQSVGETVARQDEEM